MAIVLYASDKQLTTDHHPITVKGFRSDKDKEFVFYVRAELIEDAWPGPAFRDAKAKPDEVTLNAIPNAVIVRPKAA